MQSFCRESLKKNIKNARQKTRERRPFIMCLMFKHIFKFFPLIHIKNTYSNDQLENHHVARRTEKYKS